MRDLNFKTLNFETTCPFGNWLKKSLMEVVSHSAPGKLIYFSIKLYDENIRQKNTKNEGRSVYGAVKKSCGHFRFFRKSVTPNDCRL